MRDSGVARSLMPAGNVLARKPLLRPLLALLLLNGLLSFSNWWPTPALIPDARLAPEFLWLWLILLGAVRWQGQLSSRQASLLALAYLLLVLGRYVDVTAPALFGRPLNLYWDVPQIPRFLWVGAQELPIWITLAAIALTGLLLMLLFLGVRWTIVVTARDAVPYGLRSRRVLTLTACAVVLVAANYAGVRATWPFVSKPVIPTYLRQADILFTAVSPERLAQVLPPSTTIEAALARPRGSALGALMGRDVYLMVLESYGAVVYDNPRAQEKLAAARKQFAADLAGGGHHVVSAFLRAPTFGGASDLSHLSLLSGIDLTDPLRHDLLLTTQRPTLVDVFRDSGYRVFGFYSSLSWDWPERAYYGFDEFVDGTQLDYRGPRLGPWHIPDQFAMARFEQRYPRPANAPPRFVFMPTITSHFPFSPVPPYQPDWQRILSDQPFDDADVRRALAEKPDWLDMLPDYIRMIEYTYAWLGGYFRQPPPRETIHVLVGDHQPTANISGEGASWDVPVHIIARDARLLEGFTRQGFQSGLNPGRAPLGGLHDLTAMLLKTFGDAQVDPAR